MKPLAIVFAAVVALGAIFVAVGTLWRYGVDGPLTNSIDFRAFYCAGAALDAGADPYRVEPVRSCERAALRVAGFSFAEKDVLVAPFPPVALAAFALIARLPYRAAVQTWMSLNVLGLCIAIVAMARLAALRPLYAALALVASAGFASFFLGQPIPIVIAAFALAAIAARAGNGALLAAALIVASLQPHLAAPVWIAAFVLLPAARLRLAIAAGLVLATSVAYRPDLGIEYVRDVLPMHSRAEVANFADQYGLTALVHRFGMPIPAAMRLGSALYVAMTALGLVLAGRLRDRFADPAFVVLTPCAMVTIGGPFLHGHQVAAALPFALLLLPRSFPAMAKPLRVALIAAIVLLAVPWQTLADEPGVDELFPHQAFHRPAPFRIPAAAELIDRSYTEREDASAQSSERTLGMQVAWKVPTWLALITLTLVALSVARSKPARIEPNETSGAIPRP